MSRLHVSLVVIGISSILASPSGFAQTLESNLWMANGPVHAVAHAAGSTYIGGVFSYVGPPTGSAAPIDVTTGNVAASFPEVSGQVFAVIPDGAGGCYLGGDFTSVGGQPRNRIAHVASNLTVSAWDPNANGSVRALAVLGSTVYAGGYFTSIGGAARNYLAALDAATGAATAWIPGPDAPIFALDVHTHFVACPQGTCPVTNVYVAGDFSMIGGQARNFLAAIDPATGLATAWNPNPDGRVFTIQAVGATLLRVYVGGGFAIIGGQARNRVASLTAAGTPTSWNPNANDVVSTLAVSGATVYAGGLFTQIGGQSRSHIAALDGTGLATGWDPSANASVQTILVNGSTVLAGGDFTSVGGQVRHRVATLDAATGMATPWTVHASGTVRSLQVSGSTVYVGGAFISIGGVPRRNLAALDDATGAATAWDPSPDGSVLALALGASTLYVGGEFLVIGGEQRIGLVAFDVPTGTLTPWQTATFGTVRTIAVDGSTVYAGGLFSVIGGGNNIAAFDVVSGMATAWNPSANAVVSAIVVQGATIYAGGTFTMIGGQLRHYLAALDVATGVATAWDPQINLGFLPGSVDAIAVSGSTVYAGGDFAFAGFQVRSNIAAIDAVTGIPTGWNPNASGRVRALALSGTSVFAGGNFPTIGGANVSYFAELSPATGLPSTLASDGSPWIGTNNTVRAFAGLDGSTLRIGGDFTSVGSSAAERIAAVEIYIPVACDQVAKGASWAACGTTVGTNSDLPWTATATDGSGGAFVGWAESASNSVRMNRVTADGSLGVGWPVDGVLVAADSTPYGFTMADDGAGGVFAVWTSGSGAGRRTRCQRVTDSGVTAPGWPAGGLDVPLPQDPFLGAVGYDAAADGTGGLFVAGQTHLQKLDGTGTVAPGWPAQGLFIGNDIWSIAADAATGAFVLTDIFTAVTRVSPNGTILWQTPLPSFDIPAYLVADGSGGVFVACGTFSVRLHHLGANGALAPSWPVGGLVVTANGRIADAKPDGAGGVVLCWRVGTSEIVAQRITAGGFVAIDWPANGVTVGAMGQSKTMAAIAGDGTGGAYLLWQGRTGTGPVSWWATRVCPGGSLAPDWPADGIEVCSNIRYTGGSARLMEDGAGGAIGGWLRRTATTGWAGTIQAQRLGSEPPSLMAVPIAAGSPSAAAVGNVTVTFDDVTTAGELSLALTTGPQPPPGTSTVPALAPATYELNTTATFTGEIEVCIDYDPADVSGIESALTLLHYEGDKSPPGWIDITTNVDVVENRICGRTTSLSPFVIVEQVATDALVPGAHLRLHQNRPNPFNPATTIAYEIAEPGWVRLRIFDVRGRLVRQLVDRALAAGPHDVTWMGDDEQRRGVGSGVYFYRLDTARQSLTRRMVLLR